jgi:hypothetical protein
MLTSEEFIFYFLFFIFKKIGILFATWREEKKRDAKGPNGFFI